MTELLTSEEYENCAFDTTYHYDFGVGTVIPVSAAAQLPVKAASPVFTPSAWSTPTKIAVGVGALGVGYGIYKWLNK